MTDWDPVSKQPLFKTAAAAVSRVDAAVTAGTTPTVGGPDARAVEHEVHHVAHDLARWSRAHVHDLARAGERYGLALDDDPPTTSGPLAGMCTRLSDLVGRRAEPGLLLLADLRRLHRKAADLDQRHAQDSFTAGPRELRKPFLASQR